MPENKKENLLPEIKKISKEIDELTKEYKEYFKYRKMVTKLDIYEDKKKVIIRNLLNKMSELNKIIQKLDKDLFLLIMLQMKVDKNILNECSEALEKNSSPHKESDKR